jgi:hypothetical protein
MSKWQKIAKHYLFTKDVICNPQNSVNPDSEPHDTLSIIE